MSLEKLAPFLNSHWEVMACSMLLDAGPLVQSNLTYEVEEALVTVKCPPSKVKVSICEEV